MPSSSDLELRRQLEEPLNQQCRNYPIPERGMLVTMIDTPYYPPLMADSPHYHNCMEIGLCIAGSGSIRLHEKVYPFSAGSIVVAPRGVYHNLEYGDEQMIYWRYLVINDDYLLRHLPERYQGTVTAFFDSIRDSGLFLENSRMSGVDTVMQLMFDLRRRGDSEACAELELCVLLALQLIARHAESAPMLNAGEPVDAQHRQPIEAALAYSTVNGQNHGIPFDAGTVVATYRTDLLEQAGYTIADLTDIDWDRFIEIGKDVKAKTGLPMLTGQAGSIDTVLIMLQSCGASMFNEDGSVNFVNNEAVKVVLEYYKTMCQEGIFAEVNSWDAYCGTLANSSCVGTINGCWILGTIMGVPEYAGKWALTNMPKLPGIETATHYSNNGGSSWAITNGTDIDLALDFMQLYRNVDFFNEILPTTSAIGTWAGAKDGSNYTANNEYYGAPIFATIVEYTAHVPANQTGAYYYDARGALGTAVTNYMLGGDLVSELQTAEDEINFTMGF